MQEETTWTYFGEVNYTADMVLYSVVEIAVETTDETTYTKSYTWIRTNYVHGPGCVEEVPDEFPTADFTTNSTSGLVPLTIQFTDASVSLDGISSRQWNFGDGSINSTLQNPIHKFTTTGTYTVTLTVVDADGDGDTITAQITVLSDTITPDPVIPGFPLWTLLTIQIVIFGVLINRTRKKINN